MAEKLNKARETQRKLKNTHTHKLIETEKRENSELKTSS